MQPSQLRVELLRIRKRHGSLTGKLVVDEARSEDSPLHGEFIWDDAEAAEIQRVNHAVSLIRVVKVHRVNPDDPQPPRKWHAARPLGGTTHEYVPLEEIAEDPVMAEMSMRQLERELESLLKRMEGLAGYFESVGRILGRHGLKVVAYNVEVDFRKGDDGKTA